MELIHDRLAIEIARLHQVAGSVGRDDYRPVRNAIPVRDRTYRNALRSGFEEGFSFPEFWDYTSCPLLKSLMDCQSKERVAVSLPSLRVDSLDPLWFEQIKRVKKRVSRSRRKRGMTDCAK
jgi:hypothetical protein